ncbi:MAG: hypothetical protein II956_15070 [Bacteroidales bacterium]|nr:hypothetical protein [Bacteroidales bacterium]
MNHNPKIQEIFMSLPFSEAMRKCIKETDWNFSDFHIATLIFNNCGHYEERVEHLKEISSRFENAFVPLPNPFEEGDKVRIVSTGERGVIYGSKASYEEVIERAKQDAFLDYTDTWMTIDFPDGGTYDSHTHASRFDLEFDDENKSN